MYCLLLTDDHRRAGSLSACPIAVVPSDSRVECDVVELNDVQRDVRLLSRFCDLTLFLRGVSCRRRSSRCSATASRRATYRIGWREISESSPVKGGAGVLQAVRSRSWRGERERWDRVLTRRPRTRRRGPPVLGGNILPPRRVSVTVRKAIAGAGPSVVGTVGVLRSTVITRPSVHDPRSLGFGVAAPVWRQWVLPVEL